MHGPGLRCPLPFATFRPDMTDRIAITVTRAADVYDFMAGGNS